MADSVERFATKIMAKAGIHAPGSFDLIVLELRKLSRLPNMHERVALELIAAGGIRAPGSFDLLVTQIRNRYPTEGELDEFIRRVKRRCLAENGEGGSAQEHPRQIEHSGNSLLFLRKVLKSPKVFQSGKRFKSNFTRRTSARANERKLPVRGDCLRGPWPAGLCGLLSLFAMQEI